MNEKVGGTAPVDIDVDTQVPAGRGSEPEPEPVMDELLVEDVSIDGMCGVY